MGDLKNFVLSFLLMAALYADQANDLKQYNHFAETYCEASCTGNYDSNSAYFRFFDFPLEGKRVLDLGTGSGIDLERIFKRRAFIFGIDASEEMVRISSERNPDSEIRVGYFEDIPFPESGFDVVMSKWAFQTSPYIDPIFHEVARVLKPGGIFVYLSGHPTRQFLEKKKKGKDYFQKEIVESVFFQGRINAREPSHTLNEYFSPTFFKYFLLEAYEEGFDSDAERVDGDIYPSFFIIKARRK